MSIYCGSNDYDDYDDYEWWYEHDLFLGELSTKRKRSCSSCGGKIAVGDDTLKLRRYKRPENDIEDRIYGDEVPLTAWYLCVDCGCSLLSILKLGARVAMLHGENLQIEYRNLRKESK